MSLLSSVILPVIEKQLASVAPDVAHFALEQLEAIASEVLGYIAAKAVTPKLNDSKDN